jgi:hypothetical protein
VFNESELSALEAQLAEDLKAIRRVRNLLANQRNGASKLEETALVVAETNPQTQRPSLGDVHQAVIEVLQSVVGSFTGSDIQKKLRARGDDFRNSSVRAVLHRLVKTGKIKIDSLGKGRRATIYTGSNAISFSNR